MWDPFRYKLGGRLLNIRGEEFTDRYGVAEDGKYVITRDVGSMRSSRRSRPAAARRMAASI